MNEKELSILSNLAEFLLLNPPDYMGLTAVLRDVRELDGALLEIVNFLEESLAELKLETLERSTAEKVLLKFTRNLPPETPYAMEISGMFESVKVALEGAIYLREQRRQRQRR